MHYIKKKKKYFKTKSLLSFSGEYLCVKPKKPIFLVLTCTPVKKIFVKLFQVKE